MDSVYFNVFCVLAWFPLKSDNNDWRICQERIENHTQNENDRQLQKKKKINVMFYLKMTIPHIHALMESGQPGNTHTHKITINDQTMSWKLSLTQSAQ